jgi:hypothetical protein
MQRGICHPEHIQAAADLKAKLDLARQGQLKVSWAKREIVDAFDKSNMELPPFLVPFEVPEHLDEEAIECCLEMLEKNLPPSDILMLAYSPASELLLDTAAQDSQILDLLIQRYTGNPQINQDALIKLDWVKKMGESIANEVILPKDQVEALAIEATRQQILELQSIIAGNNVPVSPRDNDEVHLDTMVQKLMPLIESVPPGGLTPEGVEPLSKAMEHFVNHIQAAQAKGMPAEQLSQYKQALAQAHKHLTQGHGTPPPPDVAPAAAGAVSGPQVTAAGLREVGQAVGSANPSQANLVQQLSNPPRPPTAG